MLDGRSGNRPCRKSPKYRWRCC